MNDILSEKDTKTVLDILVDVLEMDPSQMTNDARLTEDLGADSLDRVEIIMGLDEQFHLSIPDERLEKVQTVGDIFELLAEMLPRR